MRSLALAILLPGIALLPEPVVAQSFIASFVPQPDADEWKPISKKEHFDVYVKRTFNVSVLAASGAAAAISLGLDSPTEWGQSPSGYGKRLGNNVGRVVMRSTMEYGFATLLKEDTRYIASRKTGTMARLKYALISTYVVRNSQGHGRFAFSRLIANGGTSALSRYWYPPSWQGGDQIAGDVGIISAIQAGYNVAREFGPDIVRKLKH